MPKITIISTGREEYVGKTPNREKSLHDLNTLYRQYKVIRPPIPGMKLVVSAGKILKDGNIKQWIWIQEGLDFIEQSV